MLESRILILKPWSVTSVSRKTRALADEAGQILGFADWRRKYSAPMWRWLSRTELRIFETEDAALLCTAISRRGQRWEVRDAEDRMVGACQPDTQGDSRSHPVTGTRARVEDAFGHPVAWAVDATDSQERLIIDPNGVTLAALTIDHGTVRAEFVATFASDPFIKMVLLTAAVLDL